MRESRGRGEEWVIAQFLLVGALFIAPRLGPRWARPLAWGGRILGLPLVVGGGALMSRAFRDLGPNLTPLPKPNDDAVLVRTGVYALVRHPIYAALILFAYGVALVTGSTSRLVIATMLLALLDAKADYEESWLLDRYPDYAAYREEVPRFVALPW